MYSVVCYVCVRHGVIVIVKITYFKVIDNLKTEVIVIVIHVVIDSQVIVLVIVIYNLNVEAIVIVIDLNMFIYSRDSRETF